MCWTHSVFILIIIIYMSDILYNLFVRFQFSGYMRFTSGRHWHATNLLHDHSNLSPSYLFSQEKCFYVFKGLHSSIIYFHHSYATTILSFCVWSFLLMGITFVSSFRCILCLTVHERFSYDVLHQYFYLAIRNYKSW